MGMFDAFIEIAEAFTETSPKVKSTQQLIKPLPSAQLNALLKAGKKSEAINFLSKHMSWSHAQSEKFVNDLENTQTESKFVVHRSAKKHTSLDVLLNEQATAESKAGGNLFYYFLGRYR